MSELTDYDIAVFKDRIRALEQENARLKAQLEAASGYLGRLLTTRWPQIELCPDLMGICRQIDHLLASQRAQLETAEGLLRKLNETSTVLTEKLIADYLRTKKGKEKAVNNNVFSNLYGNVESAKEGKEKA